MDNFMQKKLKHKQREGAIGEGHFYLSLKPLFRLKIDKTWNERKRSTFSDRINHSLSNVLQRYAKKFSRIQNRMLKKAGLTLQPSSNISK